MDVECRSNLNCYFLWQKTSSVKSHFKWLHHFYIRKYIIIRTSMYVHMYALGTYISITYACTSQAFRMQSNAF